MTESFRRMKLKEEEQQQQSRWHATMTRGMVTDPDLDAMRIPERTAAEVDTEATFM
jgi:hypothetical protein